MSNTKEKKGKMKPRGGNSPVIGDNGICTNPGDNTRYAKLTLEVLSWPPINNADIEELERRLYEYVEFCEKNDIKIGNQGCYLALGINKVTAFEWEHGRVRTTAHTNFIKKVKSICAYSRELLMQDGKINPITGIFWQKNYDGMQDKQEFVLTPHNPLGDISDPDELRKRYLEAAPSEDAV